MIEFDTENYVIVVNQASGEKRIIEDLVSK